MDRGHENEPPLEDEPTDPQEESITVLGAESLVSERLRRFPSCGARSVMIDTRAFCTRLDECRTEGRWNHAGLCGPDQRVGGLPLRAGLRSCLYCESCGDFSGCLEWMLDQIVRRAALEETASPTLTRAACLPDGWPHLPHTFGAPRNGECFVRRPFSSAQPLAEELQDAALSAGWQRASGQPSQLVFERPGRRTWVRVYAGEGYSTAEVQ